MFEQLSKIVQYFLSSVGKGFTKELKEYDTCMVHERKKFWESIHTYHNG